MLQFSIYEPASRNGGRRGCEFQAGRRIVMGVSGRKQNSIWVSMLIRRPRKMSRAWRPQPCGELQSLYE